MSSTALEEPADTRGSLPVRSNTVETHGRKTNNRVGEDGAEPGELSPRTAWRPSRTEPAIAGAVKIAVPFALITLATSALLAAYASGPARRQLQSGYDPQLRQVQNAVQVVFATNSNDPQQVNALLQRIKASDNLVLVASVFRGGPPPTVGRAPTSRDVGHRPPPDALATMRTGEEQHRRVQVAGSALQVTDTPLTSNGKQIAVLELNTRLDP